MLSPAHRLRCRFFLSLPRLLAALGFVFFISCTNPPPPGSAPLRKPLEVYLQVAENYRRVDSFSGQGKIIIETADLQYAGPVHVDARLPDSLIVKVEAAFGIDVGFFFVDRNHFATYAPLENTYYSGPTRDAPALLFFHIEASFEEIMGMVVGAVLPPFDSTFAMHTDGGDYLFEGRRGDYQVRYWVDGKKNVVKRGALLDAHGAIIASQEFSRFRQKGGAWLPQLIRANSRSAGAPQRVTVFYERVETGAPIAPAEFTFKVPASAKRVELSADSSGRGH